MQVTSHIPHVHQLSQFYTESIQINVILVEYRCTRNKEHRMYFAFLPREDHIIKFGQYPSIADLSVHEIEPYRTVLSEEQFREFKRAIQLASHDIGVGSFVYLRRIIENLIEEAHVKATKSDPEWDEVDYQGKRVLERIKVLEDYLPDSLVKNRQSYAILSKGIHELSEADCRRFFNTVRLAIELILDEKLAEKRRNQKIAQVRKGLDAITNEIRSSD